MKFAHMSDCHIGSWQRTPKLADASLNAFVKAIDICFEEAVDFILISGDLFDTAIPAVDKLKEAVLKLKEVKDKGIPVYVIAGSHDYSPTGKTMLDVLEKAGLFSNVYKDSEDNGKVNLEFSVDEKTKSKIAGMLGRKGGLEKNHFSILSKDSLEAEDGFKIFMFHSGIEEYKPKHLEQMEAIPLSHFPKGFDYYAAGHIHHVFSKQEPGYGMIAFPGPLFPNNFDELEKLGKGGFYIVNANGNEIDLRHIPVSIHNYHSITMDCSGKTPSQVENELMAVAKGSEFTNTIIGIRLHGMLTGGKTTDLNLKDVFTTLNEKGAHCILKNTSHLTSEFFEEIKTENGTVEDIEEDLIRKNSGKLKIFDTEKEMELTRTLLHSLSKEKEEGERTADFERRVIEDVAKILQVTL